MMMMWFSVLWPSQVWVESKIITRDQNDRTDIWHASYDGGAEDDQSGHRTVSYEPIKLQDLELSTNRRTGLISGHPQWEQDRPRCCSDHGTVSSWAMLSWLVVSDQWSQCWQCSGHLPRCCEVGLSEPRNQRWLHPHHARHSQHHPRCRLQSCWHLRSCSRKHNQQW